MISLVDGHLSVILHDEFYTTIYAYTREHTTIRIYSSSCTRTNMGL